MIGNRFTQRNIRHTIVILCLLLATGCTTDLSHVTRFAHSSLNSAQYDRLVQQYINSPQRQKFYQPEDKHTELEKNFERRKKQRAGLLAMHAVLSDYMQALEQLASNKVDYFQKDIENAKTFMKDNEYFTAKQAKAYTTITDLLVTATTDRWRRSKIKRLIKQAHPQVEALTEHMREVLNSGFLSDVAIERRAAEIYYRTHLAQTPDELEQSAGVAALKELWLQRKAQFNAHEKRIKQYAEVLKQTGESHQYLLDHLDKLTLPAKKDELVRRVKILQQLHKQLRQLEIY